VSPVADDGTAMEVPSGDSTVTHLDVIATAQRVLASRIAELETELTRQAKVAERLRERVAALMNDDGTAVDMIEALQARIDELTAQLAEARAVAERRTVELTGLQATRLFRWSAPARRIYRGLRRRFGVTDER
jgi:chromosome segregation ATPase